MSLVALPQSVTLSPPPPPSAGPQSNENGQVREISVQIMSILIYDSQYRKFTTLVLPKNHIATPPPSPQPPPPPPHTILIYIVYTAAADINVTWKSTTQFSQWTSHFGWIGWFGNVRESGGCIFASAGACVFECVCVCVLSMVFRFHKKKKKTKIPTNEMFIQRKWEYHRLRSPTMRIKREHFFYGLFEIYVYFCIIWGGGLTKSCPLIPILLDGKLCCPSLLRIHFGPIRLGGVFFFCRLFVIWPPSSFSPNNEQFVAHRHLAVIRFLQWSPP